MRGILRMTFFKDVFIVSGSGVGGGSLGYANTLYRARPAFFEDPQWAELGDWERSWRRTTTPPSGCSGVTEYEGIGPADKLLQEYGEEIGVGETFTNTRVGVFFDEPGEEVPDPYFDGEGPDRTGCMRCGSCMVGCRHGAKNTLVKNYLWFAEKLGVEIQPERQVTEIRPLGARRRLRRLRGHQRALRRLAAPAARTTLTARGVDRRRRRARHQQACSPTASTAARCRGSPTGSATVVRTNSESIQAVTAPRRRARLQPLGRDHLEHLPRPRHPHRGRHLRPGGRRDERHLHR